jgi:hypothetical protein
VKIYRSKTVQMTDVIGEYIPVSEVSFEYAGPIAEAKGDSTAKAQEQANLAATQSQADFTKELMGTFQTQFGKQSNIYQFLQSKMQPMIDNPTGMSADALTAARTSATDADSVAYQNAQKTLNANMASRGEAGVPSGVNDQLNEALLNQEAAQKSSDQNNITLQNEQLKQQNMWNAVNTLSGVGAGYNPLGFSSSATQGSSAIAGLGNSGADLSKAVTAANGPTAGQIIGSVAGAALGAAGSAATGGAASMLKGLFGNNSNTGGGFGNAS